MQNALQTVFGFLKPYYREQRGPLILLTLCVLAETSYNVAFPLSLKYLIDDALLRENRSALVWILVVLGALAVLIARHTAWEQTAKIAGGVPDSGNPAETLSTGYKPWEVSALAISLSARRGSCFRAPFAGQFVRAIPYVFLQPRPFTPPAVRNALRRKSLQLALAAGPEICLDCETYGSAT